MSMWFVPGGCDRPTPSLATPSLATPSPTVGSIFCDWVDLNVSISSLLGGRDCLAPPISKKKADVVKHSKVFDHVGILVNGSLGTAGAPFI
jgi:hypothetical protein